MRRPENSNCNQFPGSSLISEFCKVKVFLPHHSLTGNGCFGDKEGKKKSVFITTKSYLHTSLRKCFEESTYKLNFTQLGKSFERPMWGETMLLSCQDPIWEPQSSLFHSQAASVGLFAKEQWQNKEGGQTLEQLSPPW